MAQSYLPLVSETTRASVQRVSTRSPTTALVHQSHPLTTPLVHQSPLKNMRLRAPLAPPSGEQARSKTHRCLNKRGQ